MQEDLKNNIEEMNRKALQATRELIDLNGRLMNRVLQNQLALANLYVEGGEKQLEAGSKSKDPGEYLKQQRAILDEYAQKLAKATEDNISLAQQAGEELQAWFKSHLPTPEVAKAKK